MPPPDITNLCLITAVDVEFNAAASLLNSTVFSTESQIKVCRGMIGRRHVTVMQCGMGACDFSGRLSSHLENNRYDAALMAGLAGGLDPRLKSGDAVIYDLCHNARPGSPDSKEKSSSRDEKASIRCNDEFSEFLFSSLRSSEQRCLRGAGLTVSRIITEAEDKISLGVSHQAVAVDMESYDVLGVCAGFGLPAAVLRVISDEAECNLPDFNLAAKADGRMDIWRMAAVMAARPAASLRFLRSIRFVIKNLRENLKVVLNV